MKEDITKLVRRAAERGLPFLVIGAHAVILLGYTRNTTDFDLLVPAEKRSEWLDLMRELDFRFFHERRRSCSWTRSIAAACLST